MAAPRPPRRGNSPSHGPRSKAGGPPHRGGPASRRPGPNSGPGRRPFKSKGRPAVARDEPEGFDRLQKILAHAGIGSRRACEELILQGRVSVGGQVVRELGTRVNPLETPVSVDGQKIHSERPVYFAVFKPKGYVSTNADPSGRPRVIDLLPEIPQRVYTVGRLDEMSVGLMLLTNDGELANKLSHPSFGVEKLYRVVVAGVPGREVLDQITEGVWLAEGKVRAKKVRIVARKGLSTVLEMVLAEGKNREVRRMLAKFGHKVMNLTRVAIGPITVKGLASGQFRALTGREIDLLRRVAAGEPVSMPWMGERRPPREPERAQGEARPERDRRDGPAGRPEPGGPRFDRRPSGPARRPDGDRPPMRDQRPPRPGPGYSSGPRPHQGQDRPGGRPLRGPADGPPRRFDREGDRHDGPPRRFDQQGRNDGPPRRFDQQGRNDGPPPRRFDQQGRNDGPPRRFDQQGRPGGPGGHDGPRRFDRQGGPPQGRYEGPPRRFEDENRQGPRQDGPPRRFDRQGGGGRPEQARNDGPRRFDRDARPPMGPGVGRGPNGPRPPQGRRPAPPRVDGPPQRRVIGMESAPAPEPTRDDRPRPRMKRPPGRRPQPPPGRGPKPMPRRRGPADDSGE
ncbi:pseudouridine synthase [Tundrisphaera sp. TA3]|uniref:pseudouridine synthase n=1 Tax=Tundrisphaera sp. TA3 TaxID=3435775 RepID=UPI003EBEA41B